MGSRRTALSELTALAAIDGGSLAPRCFYQRKTLSASTLGGPPARRLPPALSNRPQGPAMWLHRRRFGRCSHSSDNIPPSRGIPQHAFCSQRQRYVGGFRPGELSQSVTWSAVSSCRAFRSTASRCGPGGSATGVLITDRSHVPDRDRQIVRPKTSRRESFIDQLCRNASTFAR